MTLYGENYNEGHFGQKGGQKCHRIECHLAGPKHGIQTHLARGPENEREKPDNRENLTSDGGNGHKVSFCKKVVMTHGDKVAEGTNNRYEGNK